VEEHEEEKEPTSLPPAEVWGQHAPILDTSTNEDRSNKMPHTRPSLTAALWEGDEWDVNLPTDTPTPKTTAPQQTIRHEEDDQHDSTDSSSNPSDELDLSTPMYTGDVKHRRQFAELELHKATAITKDAVPIQTLRYQRPDPPTPGQASTWTNQPTIAAPTTAPTTPHDHKKTRRSRQTS